MKTTQAWTWLTAGVLALGLNGIYRDCAAPWAHQVFEQATFRAAAVLAPFSTRLDEFLAKAQTVAARAENDNARVASGLSRLQASAARAHSGISRIEAMSARRQAQCARMEANRARIEAEAARMQFATMNLENLKPIDFDVPEIHVNCPRVRVVIPHLQVTKPVHVDMPGAGPV